MDVSVSPVEIRRLRPLVLGNPAYNNLSHRIWSPINDDPNYEIKTVLYIDEIDNIGKKKIIVKRSEHPGDLPVDRYSILVGQATGGKKSRKRRNRNKKSRKRRNKKSRKG